MVRSTVRMLLQIAINICEGNRNLKLIDFLPQATLPAYSLLNLVYKIA